MTTRARAFYLLKNQLKSENRILGHLTFIRLFKIQFHSSSVNSVNSLLRGATSISDGIFSFHFILFVYLVALHAQPLLYSKHPA